MPPKSAHNLLLMAGFPISQHSDQDRYQNLITCSCYHPRPLHKVSFKPSVRNKHTNKQIERKTNASGNIILAEIKINSNQGSTIVKRWIMEKFANYILNKLLWHT